MPFDPRTGEHDLAAVLTLEVLFRTEVDFVMNTARRCGLSDADAEDVTQKVFLVLQTRLHTLHSPESVRPWLFTVTRRHALSLVAANQRAPFEPPAADLGEIEDDDAMTEEQMLRSERRRELLDLLEALEPSRRTILVMHVLDEVPVPEIAEVLQVPVATVYNRLRLARRDLREAFERKDLSDEYGVLFRTWQKVLTLRDPGEFFYGRSAITAAVRARIWARILEGLREKYPSFEAAERDGLRILSPMWRDDAPPRPYVPLKPRRRPRGAGRSQGAPKATGCRTP
jgi:RNA polymerase sigma-70 factor (ECF subfamily)